MKLIPLISVIALTLLACTDQRQKQKADQLVENAYKAIESRDYEIAIESAGEALEMYTQIADTLGMAESNYILARSSALSGDFDKAVRFGEAGSQHCLWIQNYPLEYKLNNVLSWAYFTLGRSFNETQPHYKRQLFVVEQLNDDEAKALVFNNYGYDATVSGAVPITDAIGYVKFANEYYAEQENNNGRWYTLMNLSWQHRLINDLSASERYGRLAVQQALHDNDRHAIVEANTNLGETLLLQQKGEEARSLYEEALTWSKQEEDRDKYVFDVYYSRYLWSINRKDSAITTVKSAIEFLKDDEIFYEMLARAFLAQYSYATNQIEEAAQQILKFKNPRAKYFSQEAKVMAAIVEAQLLAEKEKEKAVEILRQNLEAVNRSGAEILKMRISALLRSYESG